MREPTPLHLSKLLTITTLLLASTLASAQSPAVSSAPPAPQKFQGCVLPSPNDKTVLILNTDKACATLSGNFVPADISGHTIDLTGVLTPRTPAKPASIQVDKVLTIGKPCTEVCSLRPPGTRGLGHSETPGKEGGTPGAVPTQPSNPPQ
jgi:hypothetical protein